MCVLFEENEVLQVNISISIQPCMLLTLSRLLADVLTKRDRDTTAAPLLISRSFVLLFFFIWAVKNSCCKYAENQVKVPKAGKSKSLTLHQIFECDFQTLC